MQIKEDNEEFGEEELNFVIEDPGSTDAVEEDDPELAMFCSRLS